MIEFENEYDVKKLSFSQKPIVEFGRDQHLIDLLSKKSQLLYDQKSQDQLKEESQEKIAAENSIEQKSAEENFQEVGASSPAVNEEAIVEDASTTDDEYASASASTYVYISDDDLPEALHNVQKQQQMRQSEQVGPRLLQSNISLQEHKQNLDSFDLPTEIPSLIDSNVVELTPIDLNDYTSNTLTRVLLALFFLTTYISLVYFCFKYVADDAIRMVSIVSISFLIVIGLISLSIMRKIQI